MFFKDNDTVMDNQSEEIVSPEVSAQEQELLVCKQEVVQWKEQYLRVRADFENFTRRAEKERSSITLFSQNEILLGLIAIADDFDRALAQKQQSATSEDSSDSSWRLGIEMIRASLDKLLESYNVKPMADSTVFNPSSHEAISQLVVEGKASGTIVHVAQKGYMRNGVVLRPAKVVVAQ